MGDLGESDFKRAIEQAVGILHTGDARQSIALGDGKQFHHAPRCFIADADVADLSRLHAIRQCRESLFQRCRVLVIFGVVAELAEIIGFSRRPVQLIEINVVRLQPLEAGVQGGLDMGSVQR